LDQEVDFWEFSSEPANLEKMEVIARGARLFVEKLEREIISNGSLTGPKKIVLAHVEPYPFDTFSVIVYFRVEEGISFSLNLEDIRFSKESFSATGRVYAWRETEGKRDFLMEDSYGVGVTVFNKREVSLKPAEVFRLYLEMYNSLARKFGLYHLYD